MEVISFFMIVIFVHSDEHLEISSPHTLDITSKRDRSNSHKTSVMVLYGSLVMILNSSYCCSIRKFVLFVLILLELMRTMSRLRHFLQAIGLYYKAKLK